MKGVETISSDLNKQSEEIDDRGTDRNRQSKVLLRLADISNNIKAFNGQKLEQVFLNEELTRDFISNLDENDFFDLLNGVNGILRNKDKIEWGMDGENVYLGNYRPPKQEDKQELLKNLLESAKRMSSNRDIKDISLMIYYVINAVHPYSDGNGRTSRLIFELLNSGYSKDSSDKISNYLGKNGIVDLLNETTTDHIDYEVRSLYDGNVFGNKEKNIGNSLRFFPVDISDIKLNGSISENSVTKFKFIYNDIFFRVAFSEYIGNKSGLKKFIEDRGNYYTFDMNGFLQMATQDDLDEIVNIFYYYKKDSINKMIDIFENPSKDEYLVECGNTKMPILESLKKV